MTRIATNDSVVTFELGKPYQHVTMNFKNGTPVLDVRFSQLDVPSMIDSKPSSRPQSEMVAGTRSILPHHPSSAQNQARLSHPTSLLSLLDINSEHGSEGRLAGPPFFNPYTQKPERRVRSLSSGHGPHKSPLAAVRELTSQFPVVPPRAFIPPSQFVVKQGNKDFSNGGSPIVFWQTDAESITGNSSHHTPPPSNYPSTASTPKNVNLLLKYVQGPPEWTSTPPMEMQQLDDGPTNLGNALLMSKSDDEASSYTGGANPAEWIDYGAIQPAGRDAVSRVEEREGRLSRDSEPQSVGGRQKGRRITDDPKVAASGKQILRIKSIGEAPRRSTPAPVKSGFTRTSLHLESLVIASAERLRPGVTRSSLDSSVYSQDVLHDSVVAITRG